MVHEYILIVFKDFLVLLLKWELDFVNCHTCGTREFNCYPPKYRITFSITVQSYACISPLCGATLSYSSALSSDTYLRGNFHLLGVCFILTEVDRGSDT